MSSWSGRKQTNTNEFYTEGQIASILNRCNVRVGGEIDTHYLIFCPFHYNVNTPACEVDKQNGLYICFSCGDNGKIEDLVMRTTNRNYFEAIRLIKSSETATDMVDLIDSTLDKDSNPLKEFDEFTIKRLHNSLMTSDRGSEYFLSRGINEQSMVEMMLGYSDKQDMVTVPVHDEFGMCVGFVGRSVEGKTFKNSTNLPRKHVLFNLYKFKFQKLVVVESSFDAIRLWQCGIPAVATLGAIPSKPQISLMAKYASEIFVWPDNDDAGHKMVDKIINGCSKSKVHVIKVDGGKDVGDFSDDSITKIWNNALDQDSIAI